MINRRQSETFWTRTVTNQIANQCGTPKCTDFLNFKLHNRICCVIFKLSMNDGTCWLGRVDGMRVCYVWIKPPNGKNHITYLQFSLAKVVCAMHYYAGRMFSVCKQKKNNTAQTQEAIRKLWERKGVAGNFYEVADVLNVATGPCT